jgi:formate C-acetyltransferase
VAFRGTPFAFECGLRHPSSWGVQGTGTWLRDRNYGLFVEDADVAARLKQHFDAGLGHFYHFVDFDHYNLGYDVILERGLLGLIADAEAAPAADDEARAFLDAVVASLRAVLRMMERFADAYESVNPAWAAAMRRVPAHPPTTFFEALLALSATRELFATFEGVGVSILGHLDRQLAPFYDADLAAGRITEADAAELLGRFLLFTDCRFSVRTGAWAETSTTMELGGCDDAGRPFFHPLTVLILRAHRALGLLNPKPQCRVGAGADEAYLRELAGIIAGGDNILTLFNDDVLIPAQEKAGKRLTDARRYVNGGCQELMLLGCEHSEGARWYIGLPRILEVSLHPEVVAEFPAVQIARVSGTSFETFYDGVLANVRGALAAISALEKQIAAAWPLVNPCPLVSATLHDCLANGRDLTAGGGRYNPTGVCFYGFATLADSLYAVQQAVFESGICTFEELRAALRADFAGYEELLAALRKLPRYGQDDAGADAFAARVAHDVAATCQGLTNQRGGPLQPAIFSYWTYARAGWATGATPDGRHAGDYLSQGATPSRLAHTPTAAHYLRSLSAIDWTDYPAIAVFDLQMPIAAHTPELETQYVALLKTFVTLGGPCIQFTVTDPATLRAAQQHPADYPDLVVRVSGYSAYFTALQQDVQDSIITRTMVEV